MLFQLTLPRSKLFGTHACRIILFYFKIRSQVRNEFLHYVKNQL
nr:MAG TPA_asm: hypothetical protein [Caudoviricetes sp.]